MSFEVQSPCKYYLSSVPVSHKTLSPFQKQPPILFMNAIAVYHNSHTKNINTLDVQNTEFKC
jgi:hypothetical protein